MRKPVPGTQGVRVRVAVSKRVAGFSWMNGVVETLARHPLALCYYASYARQVGAGLGLHTPLTGKSVAQTAKTGGDNVAWL